MKGLLSRICPLTVLSSMAFVCGEHRYEYAPVVRNTLNRPAVLSVEYGNGDFTYGMVLAPGAYGYAPAEGIGVREISV